MVLSLLFLLILVIVDCDDECNREIEKNTKARRSKPFTEAPEETKREMTRLSSTVL
jgi:hypothetical protein